MTENIIIYVAGNPDAYPLEYYDPETQTYQGLIPQLMARFSSQSSYQVIYVPTEGEDQRDHLARNLQVDLLSGYRPGEYPVSWDSSLVLFRTLSQGQEQPYTLYLTQTAPEGLAEELEAFFGTLSHQAISGTLLEVSTPLADAPLLTPLSGGLALGTAVLAAVLAVTVRRYRRRLRAAESSRETDPVTGLGNLLYLSRQFDRLVNESNRILYSLVCFHVDTDRLRRLGGMSEADGFLAFCAHRLREFAASYDLVARVSDQIFVLLTCSGTPQAAAARLFPLLQQVRTYAQTTGKPFEVHLTAGICPLRTEDRDLSELILRAAQGARAARQQQEDYVICTQEMERTVTEERALQREVDQALADHAIQLYLQFYVDARSLRIVGGEGLARWNHPRKGLLTPGAFVPMLEREGLISKLDYYCLEESCKLLDQLVREGIDTFFLSCNFSRDTFSGEDFVSRCREIMAPYRFPRELLIFEITESFSETHVARIRQNMLALKEVGVRVALDDFGAGFTSFADLREYPVDGIKLDKDLTDHAMTYNGMAILKAMVQVGHELDLTILAEGVETEEQAEMLRKAQCDVFQGFRFFPPMPLEEAVAQLRARLLPHPEAKNDA